MKAPKLNWKEVYIVKGWQTTIIKGVGVFFPKLSEGICTYENSWLVFVEGSNVPEKIYQSEVFEDYGKAIETVKKEKQKYLEYCSKQVLEYSEKVIELNKLT